MRKPKGYWNIYDNVLNEALKYKSKTVFQEKASVVYKYSRMNGWYEDVTKHMTNPNKCGLGIKNRRLSLINRIY